MVPDLDSGREERHLSWTTKTKDGETNGEHTDGNENQKKSQKEGAKLQKESSKSAKMLNLKPP